MYEFKNRQPNQRLTYKTVNGLNLPMDIYLPDCDTDDNTQCIVLIHGGGWNDAIRDNSEWTGGMLRHQARYFAEQGCIAITISYRSLQVHDSISVYDLVEDCTDAMRYIKNNLEYVNYDRIIVLGESAGGHLSTMLGISQDDEIRPYAAISVNPVLDCTEKWSYGVLDGQDKYEISPVFQSPEKCSRFLLMHGTSDSTVDIEDTEKFYSNLKQLNHFVEYIRVPDAVHAFVLFDYKSGDDYALHYTKIIYEYIIKIKNKE